MRKRGCGEHETCWRMSYLECLLSATRLLVAVGWSVKYITVIIVTVWVFRFVFPTFYLDPSFFNRQDVIPGKNCYCPLLAVKSMALSPGWENRTYKFSQQLVDCSCSLYNKAAESGDIHLLSCVTLRLTTGKVQDHWKINESLFWHHNSVHTKLTT